MPTLLLIEPHKALRQSLRQWLEAELSPCAVLAAADLAQAIASASLHTPGMILLDLDTLSSLELGILMRLSQFCPCTTVGIGLDDTPAHRLRAELAGITTFVPKAQLQTDLVRVIQAKLQAPSGREAAERSTSQGFLQNQRGTRP